LRKSLLIALAAAVAIPALAQNSMPAAPVSPEIEDPARDIPYSGILTLDVDATDTARGIFRVRETIPVAAPGRMTLRYPQWLPGNHSPTGPIPALAGLRITGNGRPIAWRRDPRDVYAFNLDIPAGVSLLEIAFEFLSPTESDQGRVVMTPEMLNLQWEKMALYPAGHYTRQIRIRPSVLLPQGWTGIAALDGETRQANRITYGVTTFETLVDSPMFAGRHFRKWNLGNNVDLNVFADRPEDLAATPEQIATHRKLVDQTLKTFGSKHFDRYEFLLALSDEMAGIGLEHHRSSENAVPRNYFTDWANTGSTRGLLPHEFVHSWNGKFRRGADSWTPDYRTPTQNSLLWVYEGQTSFWDIVLGARSGVVPMDVALGEIASTAANYATQPGRAWRPLADTTNQPIMAYRTPAAFSSYQRGTDYYSESALIWIEVDQIIREKTGGRRSIDDFARAFFGIRPGDWGVVTYTFDDVVRTLNQVAPHDWERFLRSRVEEVAEAPLGGIRRGGYRLVWRDEPNAYDASRMKRGGSLDLSHSLGVSLGKGGNIGGVVWDSPLFRQGVTGAATIVAVNGREFSNDELKGAIKAAKGGREPIRLLIKEGPRYRTIDVAYHDGLRFPHLEKAVGGTAPLDRLLAPLK
jgi:predicted metalloprotease with PDZ domain